MPPWDLDLSQALCDASTESYLQFGLQLQSGTGPIEPWIVFHVPGTVNMDDRSITDLQRRFCEWMITCLPDVAIREAMRSLWENLVQYYTPVKSLPRGPIAAVEPRVVAVLPRNDNPDDDLVVYAEKTHKPTIDWIMRATKKK